MKKLILLLLTIPLSALGQLNSVYNATTYAYTTQVTSGNTATGITSIVANPTAFAQGIPFLPYNINAPITISRNSANAETVTPSAIANCFPNSLTCTLTATFSFKHISGESIQSGTFGLQEALNIAVAAGSGTVLIDASWGGPTGSSLITAAKGASTVMIQDNRNPSGAVFYQWNGSAYAATGGGGSTPPASPVGSIQTNGNGTAFAALNLTGILKQAGTTPGVATGSYNGTGDYQFPITISCSGTGLSCSLVGTTWTIVLSGSAGSGSVNAGNQYQLGSFPNAGSNTTIGPAANLYAVNPGLTAAQITTLIASLVSGGAQTLIFPDGTPQYALTTASNLNIQDWRRGSLPMTIGAGLACDDRKVYMSFTNTSTTVTVSNGTTFSSADVGKQVEAAVIITGTQWWFTPTIASVTNTTTAVISTPSPFTAGPMATDVGTLNTTSLQAAINTLATNHYGILPAGCSILTGPILINNGQSFEGQGIQQTDLVGLPTQDVIQWPDTTGIPSPEGMNWAHMRIDIDARLDATKATTLVNAAGTTSTIQPLYRPVDEVMPNSNNPLGAGWATNATNGVASITQNSAVICVPTALGRVPVIGQTILFRDTPAVFTATVSNNSGAGCAGGFTGTTISPAVPNVTGYTLAQTEWTSASAVQTSTTALSGTINYPVTINVSLSTNAVPGFIANFATHGHIKSGSQEFDYLGITANSITLRSGPTACSGVTCSTGFAIAPMNYCPAAYEVPYPVFPSINTSDSTPSGAVPFAGLCMGNSGISFPQANGNTNAGKGLFNSTVSDILVNFSPALDVVATQNEAHDTGCVYMAGNTASYGTIWDGIRCEQTTFGVAQGPAASGQHGVAAVGPTGSGNTWSNCSIRAAYPLTFVDFQNSKIDRCDTYSTEINQYDGTIIGASNALTIAYTIDEQTGGVVTGTQLDNVSQWTSEPENGTQAEHQPYSQLFCNICVYGGGSAFEGLLQVIGGTEQKFDNIQLSANQSEPIIVYGSHIIIKDTLNTTGGLVSNVLGVGSVLNWGPENQCSAPAAQGEGAVISCMAGAMAPSGGQTIETLVTGNLTNPYASSQQELVQPDEWNTNGSIDGAPMSAGWVFDSTSPIVQSYATCNIGSGASCNPKHIDGFFGFSYIGPNQRFAAGPGVFAGYFETPAGSNSFTLTIAAVTPGSGCSAGTIYTGTVTTTSSWTPFSANVNMTGFTGCILSVTFSNGASVDTLRVGAFGFVNSPGWVLGPATAPTLHGSCPVFPAYLGNFSGVAYFCDGGTVKAVTIS
jgi:hypothetical protein